MPSADRMTITVTQLNEYVKSLLGVDPLLRSLSLRGEISNFKRHTSGHLYFSVKDAQSVIRCVMFRQNAMGVTFAPRDGMQVVLRGYVSVYARDGQYQFYCEGMQADGIGALYQQYERNKERFTQEGLFDAQRKRPLPVLAKKIGVVTSPTGAVISDIIRVSRRRNPSIEVLLYPCKVQGEGAETSIANGIKALGTKDVDVIIVGRGGGSLEDLWAFNEEKVVRAVHASPIPVISAVGHETDFTLCDFVADVRASTPSNAAELAVMDIRDAMQHLDALTNSLNSGVQYTLDGKRQQLHALTQRAVLRNPEKVIDAMQQQLTEHGARLHSASLRQVAQSEDGLRHLAARLRTLNPEHVLKRGYAVVKKDRLTLTSVAQVTAGDELSLQLTDGKIYAKVRKTEGKNEKINL